MSSNQVKKIVVAIPSVGQAAISSLGRVVININASLHNIRQQGKKALI